MYINNNQPKHSHLYVRPTYTWLMKIRARSKVDFTVFMFKNDYYYEGILQNKQTITQDLSKVILSAGRGQNTNEW